MRGVSLGVRQGEIVGIAGVDGNGQAELVEAITGLRRPTAGHDHGRGARHLPRRRQGEHRRRRRPHPEDRHRRGLVLEFSLAENLALHDYRKEPASHFGILSPGRLVSRARGLLEEYDVRGGGAQTLAAALSGGNQQKVVIARELSDDPQLLVAAQPTRGLDVGAIEFVHRRLVEERDRGRAILLVSFELDEILGLSDRILVMYGGRIVGEYGPDVSELDLGVAMAGGGRESRGVTPSAPPRAPGNASPTGSARAWRACSCPSAPPCSPSSSAAWPSSPRTATRSRPTRRSSTAPA